MKILGINGSPRRGGNTSLLLQKALKGARAEGKETEEVCLRDLKMSPCLEIEACFRDGNCPLQDDFQGLVEKIITSDAIILASPIFFYTFSAHTKIFMDRCQMFWARKYKLKSPISPGKEKRPGAFIAVGATKGERLFEGALQSVHYLFAALDVELKETLLVQGVDSKGAVLKHATAMQDAFSLGKRLL